MSVNDAACCFVWNERLFTVPNIKEKKIIKDLLILLSCDGKRNTRDVVLCDLCVILL